MRNRRSQFSIRQNFKNVCCKAMKKFNAKAKRFILQVIILLQVQNKTPAFFKG